MSDSTAPADLGSPVGVLTIAQVAERVAHEREMREQGFAAIEHERELRVLADAHERELRVLAEEAVEKARQIQFEEYERRLTTLNHAHEAAVEAQRATVPRETFEAYQKESKTALDVALKNLTDGSNQRAAEVDRRLGLLEGDARDNAGQRAGSASTVRWAFASIAAIGGVLGIVLLVLSLRGNP